MFPTFFIFFSYTSTILHTQARVQHVHINTGRPTEKMGGTIGRGNNNNKLISFLYLLYIHTLQY